MRDFARWFTSKYYRQGWDMAKQVRRIRHAQRDILPAEALEVIQQAEASFDAVLKDASRAGELPESMKALETTANANLRPHPNAAIRENVEVVLVAVAVALGVRTFFLQPFKIPTGSMQPSLWGITVKSAHNLGDDFDIPNPAQRFADRWIRGISYHHLVAKNSGTLRVTPPKTVIPFLLTKQTLFVDQEPHTLWNPPKNIVSRMRFQTVSGFLERAGVRDGQRVEAGSDIVKTAMQRGDYLFVDRLSYNFRRPKRGEIVVFSTRNISGIGKDDEFYIKRLVGLSGETLRIRNDRKLEVDGRTLDTNDRGFEHLYTFDPNEEPRPHNLSGEFSGHVNQLTSGRLMSMPYFKSEASTYTIRDNHYMVMGDNTMNSSDSRYWGDFPRENVIGKLAFTYWPFDRRRR